MKKLILTMGIIALMSSAAMNAQVTIGKDKSPEPFSILELISNNTRGLRLPQLAIEQRDAVQAAFGAKATNEAMGLQIFNTDTECVETWNGVTWIQQCYNSIPTPMPVAPGFAGNCEITANEDNTVFTVKPDPAATRYEFIISGISQGRQLSNVLKLTTPTDIADITMNYYYPLAYLKPKMISVAGGNNWKYGDGNTNTTATIPTLKWSETPITQGQYEYLIGGNPSNFRCGGGGAAAVSERATTALPVEQVSWYAAIAYCNKLSQREEKTACYTVKKNNVVINLEDINYDNSLFTTFSTPDWDEITCDFNANGYRLPTDSEWEYAARGGNANVHPVFSGSYYTGAYDGTGAADSLKLVGWYRDNNAGTAENPPTSAPWYGTKDVKTKRGNSFGLYDMSGNVYEWTWNLTGDTFPDATPSTETKTIQSSDKHTLRGGGFYSQSTESCLVSYRQIEQSGVFEDVGFRVVCK
jgi:formylglycine-generating enzyme required for sulfatase activity